MKTGYYWIKLSPQDEPKIYFISVLSVHTMIYIDGTGHRLDVIVKKFPQATYNPNRITQPAVTNSLALAPIYQ